MTDASSANAAQDDYWNGRAGQTWVELQALLDMELQPLGREAQRALDPRPGEQVLDIGCGAGETSLDLAVAVAPNGSVLGADLSQLLLDLARSRAGDKGLPVRFLAADAQTSDFGKAPFDAAFSRFGVMFFSDPQAAFSNIAAALKPGGRLAFVCWRTYAENPLMRDPFEAALPLIPPPEPSDPLAPGPFAFADPERVRAILAGAGFADVAIRPFDAKVGGWTLDEAMIVAQRVGPLGTILRINPELAPPVLEAVRQALQRNQDADGRVRMAAAVWIVTAKRP
jgi:SAM-dependent methyltransferase